MEYLQCVYAFLAGIPFCVFFHVRGSSIFWMSLGGAIGWFFYLFSAPVGNDILQFFIGTLALALYAEIMARVRRAPATGYLHVALFPLVPGGGIYYTMEALVNGDMAMFARFGLETVASAGAIAVGSSLVSAVTRILMAQKSARH